MEHNNYEKILYEHFKNSFPRVEEEAVEYRQCGASRIMVTLSDGSTVIYNDYNDSVIFCRPIKDEIDEEEWRKRFSHNLLDVLCERHISQVELSRRTGISERTLSGYIQGRGTPSAYNLNKIARALRCSVADLICYIE